MKTWFKVSENSDFTIYNIPFGIFSTSVSEKRVGIAIGDSILDLAIAYDLGIFKSLDFSKSVLEANYLNDDKYTKDEIIIICGSFFHMEEIREILGYKEEKDFCQLNEMSTKIKFG